MTARWTVHALQGSLGEHRRAWDRLHAERFGEHPMLDGEWVDALLKNFGQGREWLAQRTDAQGQVLALCVLQQRNRLQWQSFLPSQAQVGPSLVQKGSDASDLLQALPGHPLQLDLLCLDPQLTESEGLHAPAVGLMNHALTMNVRISGSFDAYWQARTKNLRKNFKRWESKLEAESLREDLVCLRTPADVLAGVRRYADIEGAGWKGREGTALGSSNTQLSFYETLLESAAQSGRARVYELRLNSQLVASRLCISRGGVLVILKTTYDEAFSAYAVGRLLLARVLAYEFGAQEHEHVEFYTNATPEQLAWATGQRWIRHQSHARYPSLKLLQDALRHAPVPRDADWELNHAAKAADLPKDARALLDSGPSSARVDWLERLERTVFKADADLRYHWLQHKGQVVAVLPLHWQRRQGAWHAEALANFYTPLFAPGLAATAGPDVLRRFWQLLRAQFPTLASVRLAPLAPESPAWASLIPGLQQAGWPVFEFFCFSNWSLQPAPESWEAYWSQRPSELRHTVARKQARFTAQGGRLELLTRPDQLDSGLQAYQQVYAASWKPAEPYPAFIEELARQHAAQGSLRLGLAWLGERPVAAQLWLVQDGRAEIHKLAYDEAHKAHSPGSLLSAFLMRHVIEQDRVQLVDYLSGDDGYKRQWMNRVQERRGLVAYNPRTLAGALGLLREWAAWWTRRWRRGRAAPGNP